ncbi:hypothetical protein [Mariprofundus ferrooxydans]|uniref:hypothetical protein n=1 Tax=Mariprofundus ferrooxydans TaxID=314344 RepID=UPI00035ECB76|nr:hypothetical protein [Mariprofundus ferrooxydans]
MSDEKAQDVAEEPKFESVSDFLEATPPNRVSHISDLSEHKYINGYWRDILNTPDIQLHCPSDACNGIRFFRCISGKGEALKTEYRFIYLTYRCSNCQSHSKTYSIAARIDEDEQPTGELYKFGEMPTFGPPTPARLVKLIGPDRDSFLKGRRCENQGLGIGAFIYYRRVVENQKNRILEEIIKVSEKLGAPQDKIETLNAAVSETQFSKALDMAKDVIPESLLINGHSPILLLHSALSEGVHALSDEDCLELASSIRIVLGELSERLSQALKDEAELTKALSTLMNHKKG